ncbi:hypothetical protein SADUNF_Sadunf05G0019800 [Salix dunnii]|uniref:Uncharacterized protein n=1 Tax=Salix dunnii TaxID=1413687 RepID=A0A835K6B3_9ROSI|nr:hypothetical protein SADUNF_Sadunf05G0019800 [Salix dunnii]
MRWDSLKISPSREFNNHILENLSEANRKALDMWKPIEVSIYDIDTHETYKFSLAKKEAFWFKPFPDAAHRKVKKSTASNKTLEHYMYELEQRRKYFSYSVQPFRHIIKKRSLIYDQEIDKFCYRCILQWTKVVSRKESRRPSSVKCPLCKTENFSLIYGYDGSSFQRHYVNQGFEDSSYFSKKHKYRLQCYYSEPGILNDTINVSRYWKLRKYIQPNRWLESWLRREVQALLQEEDIEVILYHILGTVNSFFSRNEHPRQTKKPEMKQEEFKDVVSNAAGPFLTAKTDRFVKELELFLASGLNIEAYDDVYLQRMGWNTPKTTEAAGESIEHNPVVPYLYIFDADSEND